MRSIAILDFNIYSQITVAHVTLQKAVLSTVEIFEVHIDSNILSHSKANKILIRSQSLLMGPSQGQRAMLGGPEFVFWEILANGGGQKK